jgi:lipoprotein-releasing system permease protein
MPAPRKARDGGAVVWRIAVRQLSARRGLTAVATGGVALAVLTLVTLSGIFLGAKTQFESIILGINPDVTLWGDEITDDTPLLARGVPQPLAVRVAHGTSATRETRIRFPAEITASIEQLPQVVAAAPSLSGMALVSAGNKTKSIDLRGIDPVAEERVKPLSPLVIAGDWGRLTTVSHGVALGQKLAKELGVVPGDVIHAITAAGVPLDLEVVAVFDSRIPAIDASRGFTLLHTAQLLFGRPDAVSRVSVKLHDPKDAPAVAALLERMFAYDAESWQEASANFLAILSVQRTVAGIVMSAVLLLGGFGILAVQIMLVLQKQKDIAILRAVGFRRSDILRVFLLHAISMGVVGGIIGDGLGKLAIEGLGRVRVTLEGTFRSDTIVVADHVLLYVAGLAFAFLVGIVASLFPAWRASRVEPVAVLRGQVG